MAVLIIGSEGYIGSELVKKFKQENVQVNEVDYMNDVHPRYDEKISEGLVVKDYKDLTDYEINTHSHVIWVAGHSSVQSSSFYMSAYKNNVANLIDLVNRLEKSTVFIYASSGSVYSSEDNYYATEQSPTYKPRNIYDFTKITFDHYTQIMPKSTIGLRFGTVNGYSKNMKKDIMLNSMVRSAKLENKIILSNENSWRSILWMKDLVNAVYEIYCSKEKKGIYNLASFNSTIGGLALAVSNMTDVDIVREQHSLPTYNYSMSSELFKKTFNFNFQGTEETIIEDLLSFDY